MQYMQNMWPHGRKVNVVRPYSRPTCSSWQRGQMLSYLESGVYKLISKLSEYTDQRTGPLYPGGGVRLSKYWLDFWLYSSF